jgi:hypothetical protein
LENYSLDLATRPDGRVGHYDRQERELAYVPS